MNKLTLDAPFQGPPAPAAAAAQTARSGAQKRPEQDPAGGPPQSAAADAGTAPVQPPRLSAAVLAQIADVLREGEVPLAAQADLVELHKRIVALFATLNEGLGAQAAQKAAADRAALTTRIDQLEAAVNRMEGALRIEFEPVLRAALAEALAQAAPKPRRRWLGGLAAGAALAAALAAGAWAHAPLQAAAQTLADSLAAWLGAGG
ncbi:hypothetical protein [Leisingera sp. ANG-M7]|uniref:hypothetical protein n=1 Tax=Leisingera sp. ANG-M7 TaxID=1577902 RepID=UPI000690A4A4|nr:hypothetical protein [Leisingera sp. ANG-M7]